MRAIYSFIFDRITDPLTLPIEWYWEWIILAIIELIALRIAWKASPGGRFGSEKHWIVRIVAFVAIWFVTYVIIIAVKWIFENWLLILSIIGGVIIAGVVTAIILFCQRKRKAQ